MVVVIKEQENEPIIKNNNEEQQSKFAEAYWNNKQCDIIKITSPEIISNVLLKATKNKDFPLAKFCIENLDKELNYNNVLDILTILNNLNSLTLNEFEPSAPPIIENNDFDKKVDDSIKQLMNDLRHNCFLEIDRYSDYVLKQSNIVNLNYIDLLEILNRNTLGVSREILVYVTIIKWGKEECNRRSLEINSNNLKNVLKQLCYCPRYGLMTKKEFTSNFIDGEKGPMKSGILNDVEYRNILFYIKEKQKNHTVNELPFKASQNRIIGHEKPKLLSSNSNNRALSFSPRTSSCTSPTICEKLFFNMVTCWAAIFD